MSNATFFNWTDKPFTGYWNGKGKTFGPGERARMPAFLAEHFAKHLTNRELIAAGKETYTSPKNPGQVPIFMEIFQKAFIPDAPSKGGNEIDELIESAEAPSMNITMKKPEPIDQGPAAALANPRAEAPELDIHDANDPRNAPSGPSMVIGTDDGDDDQFETGDNK